MTEIAVWELKRRKWANAAWKGCAIALPITTGVTGGIPRFLLVVYPPAVNEAPIRTPRALPDPRISIVRRNVFDHVSLIPIGYGAYFLEFLYTCRRKGLTVHEVPYTFKDRQKGVSKSAPSLGRFFKMGLQYVIRIFMACLRRIN